MKILNNSDFFHLIPGVDHTHAFFLSFSPVRNCLYEMNCDPSVLFCEKRGWRRREGVDCLFHLRCFLKLLACVIYAAERKGRDKDIYNTFLLLEIIIINLKRERESRGARWRELELEIFILQERERGEFWEVVFIKFS